MNQELIRKQLLFAGLSEKDIEWLGQMAEQVNIKAGEYLMREGEPGDALYLVMDGEFRVTKRAGNSEVVIAIRGAGEVFGEASLLEARPRTASVQAVKDSILAKISQAVFYQLIETHPRATLSIMRTMMDRLRNTEAMVGQNEKMAALGTLAAGLAHELNNPAAAMRRSASQLRETLERLQKATIDVGMLTLNTQQSQAMTELHAEIIQHETSPAKLDPLTRSDRESDLQTWLEDREIDEAWELVPALVAFVWDVTHLEKLTHVFSSDQWKVVVKWLGYTSAAYALLGEITQSAERISEIVKAVKSYSFLDQAPIQQIDVHEGLENTLVMLRHKLKEGIHVIREYAPNLPKIEAYGSELNQVWTNIIDNACDAMQGKGELKIKTYERDNCVVVEIIDNGPGIAEKIQSRIFEAFFTTKPPGVGTGLGLHISYNIIQKHRGDIKLTSKPGETKFIVSLPIQLQK